MKLDIEGLNEILTIMHLIKKGKKECVSVKNAFETLMGRMHLSLSLTGFLQQIVANSVFHFFDIVSQTAYAVESALDGGYWDAGYAAGQAWAVFLFNDISIKAL